MKCCMKAIPTINLGYFTCRAAMSEGVITQGWRASQCGKCNINEKCFVSCTNVKKVRQQCLLTLKMDDDETSQYSS